MQNSIIVGVVEEANRLPFGLVSYTCTCSDRNRDRPGKVKAGMISINSFAWLAAPSPFVFLIRSSLAAASSRLLKLQLEIALDRRSSSHVGLSAGWLTSGFVTISSDSAFARITDFPQLQVSQGI
jgi:hypothetical protein